MSKTYLVWSCAHSDPSVGNERFDWLGELIYDIKPDVVVDLGDFDDMRSLNTYDTQYPKAISGQSYAKDIEHGQEARDRLWRRYRLSKKKRPFRVGFEGNHECFQAHTEIFTNGDGWKYVTDIDVGDEVIDKDGHWQKVEMAHEFDHKGPMYSYQSQTGEFVVTPNHRVYYYGSSGKMFVKAAKDTPQELDLPVATQYKGEPYPFLNDAQIKLCAIALTDSYHKNGKCVFYQSGEKAKVIEQVLIDNNITYRKVTRDREIKEICGVPLKSIQTSYEFHFDRPSFCPDQNMRIPGWLFRLPEDQAEIFLDMLILCDGSTFDDRQSRVFYGKKQICDDVQAFCQMHGHRASITEYREGQFRVNINPRHKQRFKKVVTGEIEDKVYCITVKSGNFLARQGGVSMFTGNCRIKKAIAKDPRIDGKGSNYGVSFSHLQTDYWYDEYHEYTNSAPALADYDGITFGHFVASGAYGNALSGKHHAHSLVERLSCSVTVGHSHELHYYRKAIARPYPISGVVAGCFKGKEETWAGQSNREWSNGVVIKTNVENGDYDFRWVSLKALQKEYGNG
jgi:hypothetical protein